MSQFKNKTLRTTGTVLRVFLSKSVQDETLHHLPEVKASNSLQQSFQPEPVR